MDWDILATNGYVTTTGKGRRVALHVRVYADGKGQLIIRRDEGGPAPLELMCNGPDDAIAYLCRLWETLVAQAGEGQQLPQVDS
jgi:hypothetical protein